MSTEGRSAESSPARAEPIESAGFVHVVTRADGDALAASGLLASTLADRGTPYQVSVGRTVADRTERVRDRDHAPDDVTIAVGAVDGSDADVARLDADDRPATLVALEIADALSLETTPDYGLALAGLVAAGVEPGAGESEWVLETARTQGLVERRPGVAVPTADPVDGLAHSTRLRAPWSGDPDATRDALAGLEVDLDAPETVDADDRRAIGSVVAIDVVGDADAAPAAAETIGHALRPYATPDGPFATVGGYADVLEATARVEPGTGAALAMGHTARGPAIDAWREHGRTAHTALESASTGRYDGLFVVGIDDGPVETVARLGVGYCSPEPTVLAVSEGADPTSDRPDDAVGEAAIVTREDDALDATVEAVARELEDVGIDDVAYDGGRRRGYLRYNPDVDQSTIVQIVRELR
ncbi:exonuclease [Natronolimnohabitans sp. A-GB9]|uniref:exonuclease n=1 Tax=Natronolimnohabitans sp. A-GB9 TaxID=3069757 RepID=UPI0027B1FFCE|nr:exonuclease [Natronolimnohabitans sp. A-GB9]MDQ2049210.1 exonuclease [Natronolimnohabitans sp. A-GB9]